MILRELFPVLSGKNFIGEQFEINGLTNFWSNGFQYQDYSCNVQDLSTGMWRSTTGTMKITPVDLNAPKIRPDSFAVHLPPPDTLQKR